jgi:DNA ligase-1
MFPYARIASALEEISAAPRRERTRMAAGVLFPLERPIICPVVRLLSGELWPTWELRVMGVGPQTIALALDGITSEDVHALGRELGEMGAAVETALLHRSQRSLTQQPLEALFVYQRLRSISLLKGYQSEHRKSSMLRGLFQDASPLEGKYIARTALGSMQAGLGPQTMIRAFSSAWGCDPDAVRRASQILPELGLLAEAARDGHLEEIKILPSRPVRPMIFPSGEAAPPRAYLPWAPGLRVQVHRKGKELCVFTSRLHDIALALSGLKEDLARLDRDFIADAQLLTFQEGIIQTTAEVIRYINRRHRTRRSRVLPALLAFDLIWLEGEEVAGMPFLERYKRLEQLLGEAKGPLPLRISPAELKILPSLEEVEEYCRRVQSSGFLGLAARDINAPYLPGGQSSGDALVLRARETVSAAIIQAEAGEGSKEGLLVRYGVALRKEDILVPVGWVSAGLSKAEVKALSQALQGLAIEQTREGISLRPQMILKLSISGLKHDSSGYNLIRPLIKGYRFDAAAEEVDALDRVEEIYKR